MQIGSTVATEMDVAAAANKQGIKIKEAPVKGEPYVIRDMFPSPKDNKPLVLLNEIIVGYTEGGKEIALDAGFFKELLPPMNAQAWVNESVKSKKPELV